MTDRLSAQRPKNTIIVPAYKEEEGLPVVLTKIFQVIDDTYEVIVVDDGSDDGTLEAAGKFPVRLIRHETNKGKGEALKTGIIEARGEKVIWTDADDTYPTDGIPKIVQALDDYDLVVCSRRYGQQHIPLFNRLGNLAFRTMIKYIYGFTPFDPCTGLYAARKVHLDRMKLSSHRFAIEPEISMKASRMKLKMLDIPIEYRARIGTAKLNGLKAGYEDMTTILKLLFWYPKKEKGNGKETA